MPPKRQESAFPTSLFTGLKEERTALLKKLAESEAVRKELTAWNESGKKKVFSLVTRFNAPKQKDVAKEETNGAYRKRYETVLAGLETLSNEPLPEKGAEATEQAKESLAALPFQHGAMTTLIRIGLEDGLRKESREEILRLRKSIQAKETKIIKGMEPHTQRIAWRLSAAKALRSMTRNDLEAEGTLGVLHATEFFDSTNGVPFEAFATPWIYSYAYNALVQQDSLVRLPRGPRAKVNLIARALWRHEAERGGKPTIKELAEKTGLSEKDVGLLQPYAEPALKAETKKGQQAEQSDEAELAVNLIEDEKQIPVDTEAARREKAAAVEKAFKALPPREKTILCLRHGLDNEPPMTQKEVGALFGFTRQRVKQLEIKALKTLRNQCERFSHTPS